VLFEALLNSNITGATISAGFCIIWNVTVTRNVRFTRSEQWTPERSRLAKYTFATQAHHL